MSTYEGVVNRIIFKKEETGFVIFSFDIEKKDGRMSMGNISVLGTAGYICEEDLVQVTGEVVNDKKWGRQMKADCIIKILPSDVRAIKKYLIKNIYGIGEKTAKRIVDKYGEDTFNVIAENPEELTKVSKISKKKAKRIADEFAKLNMSREETMFLMNFGLSDAQMAQVRKVYGKDAISVLSSNPYKLVDDIKGVGFKKADAGALKIGIPADSLYRLEAATIYFLEQMSAMKGHVYMPANEITKIVVENLSTDIGKVLSALDSLSGQNKIVYDFVMNDEGTLERRVYLSKNYRQECLIASVLAKFTDSDYKVSESKIKTGIKKIESETGRTLDDSQRAAVIKSVSNQVSIITGGPGVGKTTTLDVVIRYLERFEKKKIKLLAPTGRAAKRMSEQTGKDAYTIHRCVLSLNDDEFIDADVVIVDEMSMVDQSVMCMLLEALKEGTMLILVGDVDQIPSVGPGLILRDMIESGKIPTSVLDTIHRQAAENHIITNAHKINRSEPIELNGENLDFFFAERNDCELGLGTLLLLYEEKFPKSLGIKPTDVQVLCPMKKGVLGTENLNKVLQERLNPHVEGTLEYEKNGNVFRIGDKVMQTKNNYALEWEAASDSEDEPGYKGKGIFNGEQGFIVSIDDEEEEIRIRFEDGKTGIYAYENMDEVILSYAITIHKSQGSEFPAVILPLVNAGPPMLYNKNLLYTAVTRAKQSLAIVGTKKTVNLMIKNRTAQVRCTGLCGRLAEKRSGR